MVKPRVMRTGRSCSAALPLVRMKEDMGDEAGKREIVPRTVPVIPAEAGIQCFP